MQLSKLKECIYFEEENRAYEDSFNICYASPTGKCDFVNKHDISLCPNFQKGFECTGVDFSLISNNMVDKSITL